ncbi:hypothetical protein HY990_02560 [Candidatus Micrarchaeota archaeon]|nr:hypothetical protein [Candidatus Micrarchaeota archaeon]
MKYSKSLWSYAASFIFIALIIWGVWFFGWFLLGVINLSFSNPTKPGIFDFTGFLVLGSVPLLLLLGCLFLLFFILLGFLKAPRSIEITKNQIQFLSLAGPTLTLNVSDIEKLVYVEVDNGESITTELRLYYREKTHRMRLPDTREKIQLIAMPESFNNYKSFYSELESVTGLKIEKTKERATLFGRKTITPDAKKLAA